MFDQKRAISRGLPRKHLRFPGGEVFSHLKNIFSIPRGISKPRGLKTLTWRTGGKIAQTTRVRALH
jgi:hypothetical protein